jgi:hypothetical protein
MKRESKVTRPGTNKLKRDYSAFVQYAVRVITVVREREKAESVRRGTLPPK